jgi:hypothetical protein
MKEMYKAGKPDRTYDEKIKYWNEVIGFLNLYKDVVIQPEGLFLSDFLAMMLEKKFYPKNQPIKEQSIEGGNALEQVVSFIKELKAEALQGYVDSQDVEIQTMYSSQNMVCGLILDRMKPLLKQRANDKPSVATEVK